MHAEHLVQSWDTVGVQKLVTIIIMPTNLQEFVEPYQHWKIEEMPKVNDNTLETSAINLFVNF